MKDPKSILITGASSGIGRALALRYAGPGVSLFLTARNQARLEEIARACEEKGAEVQTSLKPVEEREGMQQQIADWDAQRPLDLVIANAGIDGSGFNGDDIFYGVMEVNFYGVMNTVLPALAAMKKRNRGQIAIISSLAGFRGLASAAAYSTSKVAVKGLGEALRARHARDGVEVNVVCPGFVKSRITADNRFPMPFLMEADKAAEFIARRLERNKGRIAFPWPMHFAVWLLSSMPSSWADRLTAKAPRKR